MVVLHSDSITELSEDYAKILRTDVAKNVLVTSEVLEETLTRLEEFLTVMNMVQGVPDEKQVERLLDCQQQLTSMGILIDGLESMVALVTQTVNQVETQLITCEMDTASGKGNILSLFKPFFRRSENNLPSTYGAQTATVFEPPEIFKTSDLFPKPQ